VCSGTWMHVLTVTFLQISRKPQHWPQLDCIFGKPIKHRFQRCIVHMEILSTFHAQVKYIYVYKIHHRNQWATGDKKPQKPLHPLQPRGPPSSTSMPGTTQLTTPNDSSTGSRTSSTQLCNKVPTGCNGMPLPLWWSPPASNGAIPCPTPLTISNGIRIQSSILP